MSNSYVMFLEYIIHYYIKKLERLDYIKRQECVKGYRVKTRGAITLFDLTQNGSKFLEEIEKRVFSHEIRLHNCYWLYPIVQQPRVEIDWRRVELHNWGQLIGRELGLTVRKNTNSLEILTSVLQWVILTANGNSDSSFWSGTASWKGCDNIVIST